MDNLILSVVCGVPIALTFLALWLANRRRDREIKLERIRFREVYYGTTPPPEEKSLGTSRFAAKSDTSGWGRVGEKR